MTVYKHDLAPSSTSNPDPPFVLLASPFLPFDAAEPSFIPSALYALISKSEHTLLPPSLLARIELSLSNPARPPNDVRALGAATARQAFLAQHWGATSVKRLLEVSLDFVALKAFVADSSFSQVSAFAVFFDESPSPYEPTSTTRSTLASMFFSVFPHPTTVTMTASGCSRI